MLSHEQFRMLAIRLLTESSVSEPVWLSLKEGLESSGYSADILLQVEAVPQFSNKSLFVSNEEPIGYRYYLPEGWNR